jgi:hypothetical protein
MNQATEVELAKLTVQPVSLFLGGNMRLSSCGKIA